MKSRIKSLEGVRAFACICVFLCHFRLAFLPSWSAAWFDNTPLRILTDGNMVVRILFVLSGFVICLKYFQNGRYESIPGDILKRWFRFAPPILMICLIAYAMMKLGCFYHMEAAAIAGSVDFLPLFNNFAPSIKDCLYEGLISCILMGKNLYVGPTWTMIYEYFGPILVLCVLGLFRDKPRVRVLFYAVMLLVFSSYYNYFVLGMLICDIYCNTDINTRLKRQGLLTHLVLIVCFCAMAMVILDDGNKLVRMGFGLAVSGFFISYLNSGFVDKLCENSLVQWIGKLSFAIYLVHWPIMESFSCWYYLQLVGSNIPMGAILLSDLLLTFVLILIAAVLFHRYVERLGQIAAEYFLKVLLK